MSDEQQTPEITPEMHAAFDWMAERCLRVDKPSFHAPKALVEALAMIDALEIGFEEDPKSAATHAPIILKSIYGAVRCIVDKFDAIAVVGGEA